jgi:hypothetical protein
MKGKSTVDSLRHIVQDLPVPALKAVKAEMAAIRSEMTVGFESVRTEMRLRDEQSQAIQALSDKLGYAIDIQARLAVLEDRVPRA